MFEITGDEISALNDSDLRSLVGLQHKRGDKVRED